MESLDKGASARSPVMIGNTQWQLGLKPGSGLKAEVVHTPSGIVLAEGNYSYSFGTPSFTEAAINQDGKTKIVRLTGEIPGGIELHHEFRAPADVPGEAEITISNRGSSVLDLPSAAVGWPTIDTSGPGRDRRFAGLQGYRRALSPGTQRQPH